MKKTENTMCNVMVELLYKMDPKKVKIDEDERKVDVDYYHLGDADAMLFRWLHWQLRDWVTGYDPETFTTKYLFWGGGEWFITVHWLDK